MKVLVGCEESQAVCIAFRERGHEAYSCDLQPCSGGHPEWHIQGDVFQAVKDVNPDLGIFFPPCTYLSYVGNRWLSIERYGNKAIERLANREQAKDFFMALWNLDIKKIAIENPRGYVMESFKPTQIIQPYYFGDSFSKTTCLWLKNLPPLYHNKSVNLFDDKVTHVWKGEMHKKNGGMWYNTNEVLSMSPEDRSRYRSKTFPGIAKAMSEQWG
jgi:hypothetical protein